MTHGIFVTGTDTGVGKTVVAAGLVRLAGRGRVDAGRRASSRSPPAPSRTPGGPAQRGRAGAGRRRARLTLPYAVTNPWCFEPADRAAPRGRRSRRRTVDPASSSDWYAQATAGAELAIVEGAGGWRVPLHPDGFLSDLPERLGLDVVLVVGLRLGCLNHARLTVEAIERSGRCRLLGWVGNQIDPGFARLEDNLATLARLLGGPPLAVLPPLAEPTPAAVAALSAAASGCDACVRRLN